MGVLKSKSHIAVLLFMSWTAWVCLTITLHVADNFWPQRWKWNENLTWTLDNMEVCLLLPPVCQKSMIFPFFSGTLPLFSEHFTTFSISSNHRNFFVPFPFPFPSIPGNNSLWFPFPNFGNVFFHSLPVPEFRECLFSFPSRSRILGMDFFIPFPFPNFGNGIFNSLPVPKLWEWNFLFPFPFPNPQKSFPLTPVL